jgi:hypothetical protein
MMNAILNLVKDIGFRLVSYGGGSVTGHAIITNGHQKYKITVEEVA